MAYLKEKIEDQMDLPVVPKTVDVFKERCHQLAFLLRQRDKWPKDFKWNYDAPHSCAVGLLVATGALPESTISYHAQMTRQWIMAPAAYLGLTEDQSYQIFSRVHDAVGKYHRSDVRPEEVASALERV